MGVTSQEQAAEAVHGDLIHLAEGLRHVLGDLRQGVHDHLDHSGLAVLLHGLRLLVDTLGLCQGLGPDGFGFRLTDSGNTGSFLLLGDIVNGTTQVTEGISAGMGLDLKSLLAGALGGKLAAGNSQPVQVTVAPQAQPDAAAASADTPEQQV